MNSAPSLHPCSEAAHALVPDNLYALQDEVIESPSLCPQRTYPVFGPSITLNGFPAQARCEIHNEVPVIHEFLEEAILFMFNPLLFMFDCLLLVSNPLLFTADCLSFVIEFLLL